MSIKVFGINDSNIGLFIDFPYELFKNHPFWVSDFRKNVRHLLTSHPFWNHAEKKLFIAEKEGKPAGRIAAIVNHKHNDYHKTKMGFFGFFDSINDKKVSNMLFESACDFLKEKGMRRIAGPTNPSMNETCGMLIEGFDLPPMIMMSYNPDYYNELVLAAGFAKAKDLYAFKRETHIPFPENFEKIVSRLYKRHKMKIKNADTRNILRELDIFKNIYNQAWSRNWGFVPMDSEEMTDLAKSLGPILKPEYLYFAEMDGKAAGFTLLLPDFYLPLKEVNGKLNILNFIPFLLKMSRIRRGRLLALGVKKEFRNRGIELALIRHAIKWGEKSNWEWAELSWTLEDNDRINRIIEMVGGKVYKKYRIYEKYL